ncbi:MAG TPA: hypothetical protein VFR09_06465 [Alphaproteobacteria bacterium]|nr:hypothetical protein [Alphaproteobacteria bacterium]
MKRGLLWAMLVIAFGAPIDARADVTYKFVKMVCDPGSNTMHLKSFYEENEAGAKDTEVHEKDVYSLGVNRGSKKEVKASCKLDGQNVAFVAYQAELPRGDAFWLFLNGKKVTDPFPLTQWAMDVSPTNSNEFNVRFCPEFSYDLRKLDSDERAELRENTAKKCEILHIWGTTIQDYEVIDADQ